MVFEARGGAGRQGWGRECLRARGGQPPAPRPSLQTQSSCWPGRGSARAQWGAETARPVHSGAHRLPTGPVALCRKHMGSATKAPAQGLGLPSTV